MAKSFENLKNYTISRSEKTKMYNFARQHYIYTLGKRIMENLRTHSLVKNDKKLLYQNVAFDHEVKVMGKGWQSLRKYQQDRAEQRLCDIILRKEV